MTQSINKNQTRNIPGITRITKANQSQQDKGITMGV